MNDGARVVAKDGKVSFWLEERLSLFISASEILCLCFLGSDWSLVQWIVWDLDIAVWGWTEGKWQ